MVSARAGGWFCYILLHSCNPFTTSGFPLFTQRNFIPGYLQQEREGEGHPGRLMAGNSENAAFEQPSGGSLLVCQKQTVTVAQRGDCFWGAIEYNLIYDSLKYN